jgi:Uma2 family endonuclease
MATATIDRSKEWTVEDFLSLEEKNTFCEIINGELIMSPSPTPYHQIVLGNLYDILKSYSKNQEKGSTVFFAPLDLFLDDRNVFQPDLIYISEQNKNIITDRGVEGVPDLIVEIISPSNQFADRNKKKKTYQQMGVGEYWIVDPANKTLEVYYKGQLDTDTPTLYVVESGTVTSQILIGLQFGLEEIF